MTILPRFCSLGGTTQEQPYSPQKVSQKYKKGSCADVRNLSPPTHTRPHTGRLYQVEYAMEAIGHAGTCLGVIATDGVLVAAERKNVNKLLDDVIFSDKIYKLDEYVLLPWKWASLVVLSLAVHRNTACSVAGITSDANVLTNQLRLMAQRYSCSHTTHLSSRVFVGTEFGKPTPPFMCSLVPYKG